MEIKMTPELQEAYNEWLLLYGFREVPRKDAVKSRAQLYCKIGANTAKQVYKELGNWPSYTYQLKTLEELE